MVIIFRIRSTFPVFHTDLQDFRKLIRGRFEVRAKKKHHLVMRRRCRSGNVSENLYCRGLRVYYGWGTADHMGMEHLAIVFLLGYFMQLNDYYLPSIIFFICCKHNMLT